MAAGEEDNIMRSSKLHSDDSREWVPLALTLVEYPQGDIIGKLLALISLTPFAILAGFIALILFRRDLHTIAFFGGTALNEILNIILKHIICEARPMSRSSLYTEYGMPSSHSQFMWFFATYCILFITIRLHHLSNSAPLEYLWKYLVMFICVFFALLVTFSRVYLQYHTVRQVFFGALAGIVFSAIWFIITHFILTPYFPVMTTWRISEMLLIRDTSLIPNILWFEYTNTRQESRARGRKLISMKSQ